MRFRSLLVFTVLFAACQADASSGTGWAGTIDTLPGGIPMVKNPDRGLWKPGEAWRVVEEARIGTESGDGPASFSQIRAFEVDRAGRIYVLDSEAQEIRVFDSTGAWVRTIGRKGGGPGEFKQAIGMRWDPAGRLWVVDQANGRFSLFDTAGTLLTSYTRLTNGVFTWDWGGSFVPGHGLVDIAYSPGMERQALVLLDSAARATPDTFPVRRFDAPAFEISDKNRHISANIPFAPALDWLIGPAGDFWYGISDSYRIVHRRLEGDTLRIIEKAWTPVRVTQAERDTALQRYEWFTRQGGTVDASRIPDTKPAFERLTVDDRGDLWVRPGGAPAGLYDVFDPEGRYLGVVHAGVNLKYQRPLIRGDHLYAAVVDTLGVPYMVEARIER